MLDWGVLSVERRAGVPLEAERHMAAGGRDVSRQLLMHALMDGEETSVLCVRQACALACMQGKG